MQQPTKSKITTTKGLFRDFGSHAVLAFAPRYSSLLPGHDQPPCPAEASKERNADTRRRKPQINDKHDLARRGNRGLFVLASE
ncbi:hypothetical protein E2C01_076060 [Portunus trituberculatus]|uniref:Uncharacterized protein n=1 Tax=Portunus trituberculatus TaxID=210409 RepID=A0A5B7IM95_PORTR|nr:hypothetical protein [Portunus trituberculatus]